VIVELARFRQVSREGSGQVLRVRSAAMDPDAVSTPHRVSGDERLRANPRRGMMESWGCPWFPFVLELLRESAAKSPSPLTNGGPSAAYRPQPNWKTGSITQYEAIACPSILPSLTILLKKQDFPG
jgi:hypothetical protein